MAFMPLSEVRLRFMLIVEVKRPSLATDPKAGMNHGWDDVGVLDTR